MKKLLYSLGILLFGISSIVFADETYYFSCYEDGSYCDPGSISFPSGYDTFEINLISSSAPDPLYGMWLKGSNENEVYYSYSSSNVFSVSDFGSSVEFLSFNTDTASQDFSMVFSSGGGGGGENTGNTMTSLECQTEYGLIPVSDVDSSYCVNNGLCPSSELVWSNLYINDILHVGSPTIYIDIPEEFEWNYDYLTGDMYIDIVGYNVDSNYINGIITTQKYLPTDTDFNKIITDLIPIFVPGLIIILCLYFIFRFIKKVF